MQNPSSVITNAVEGIGTILAKLRGVSVARIYQILEADHYGKTRDLIHAIALIDKNRARLIQADMNSFFKEILGDDAATIAVADVAKETNDVVMSIVRKDSDAEQLRECREAMAALQSWISQIERKNNPMQTHDELQTTYITSQAA